ncbi:Flp pilus assembly complex ATPase component TadA [Sulfidibacter corallicola]|uniref:Flp pilus assembly complex ATPase component TadA n=1 Tax=Sulfidibacter corallicola TaxID=2818388 RepID=A0A8A4TW07_SULCO|nr:GspE/PulE family protein [Sulfidibacter corallicola]QTD53680.1 Flp pilus assembly complex ATPase component TadA [Sulfidibacter corallicola]
MSAEEKNPVPEADLQQRPIGELLIEEGLITKDQLGRALRIQSKLTNKKRVGRILIELGFIREKQLEEIMVKYARKIRLGDLLVEREFIKISDLEEALALQKRHPNKRLGEILLETKKLTEKTLCDAISLYLKMERVVPDFRKLDHDLVNKVSLSFLQQNMTLPYREVGGSVQIVVTQTFSDTLKPIFKRVYQKPLEFCLATPGELETIFQYLHHRPKIQGARELEPSSDEQNVSGMLDSMISEAIERGASDIHFEPMDTIARVRFRIDGRLIQHETYALDRNSSMMARIKVLSNCDISERRNHQDGKCQVNFHGHPIDLRVSIFVTVHGESAVIRILNPFTSLVGLQSLGLNPRNLERYVDEVIGNATGIVLITGPTGSGKTTTLYSTLQYQLLGGHKIVTVEDPVEYIIPEIVQCSVDERAGRTFSSSLKAIMRQDPDIIVLGEIRDLESANIAIHASMTGHKVYATFHTEDATGALIRLVQMGVERYLVASTVLGVVAQRLVRGICKHCQSPHVPQAKQLRRLGLPPKILSTREFVLGQGCETCYNTGYSGRMAIHELLILEEQVRDAVLRDASSFQIRNIAMEHADLITMAEDAVTKICAHRTSFEEVLQYVPVSTPVRPLNQLLEMVE